MRLNTRRGDRGPGLLCGAVLSALLLVVLVSPLASQQPRFEDATTVTVVEVPVQVTLEGEPLRTLTRDDFELYDDRRRQEITGFDLIDLTTTRELRDDIPIAARRHFLALFDLTFSQPDSARRAQEAAARLVLEHLHPTDLVAVATYTVARGPQLVLGFTSDRIQIHHAITTLGLVSPGERVADPLGLVIADIGAELPESPSGAGAGGAAGVGEMIAEQTRDLEVLQGRVARDQQKNQVLALTSSLEQIARLMDSVQGRKHVLFLSEGFDSSVLVGVEASSQEDQQRIQEISQAAQDGEIWRVDSEERFGSGQTQSALNRMVEEFRRANCTIQAIDIGGLVAGRDNPNLEGLFMMARDTGGELYSNYNDLGEAMSEMLERTSATYLLAFQPDRLKPKDKYHRLKVKLKDAPRGTQIVHRPGYFPPRPYAERSPLEQRLLSAEELLGGYVGGSVGTAVLAAAFEMGSDRAYAPVLVEVDGRDLIQGSEGGVASLEIYAYALDPRGTVRDFYARKIGFDLERAGSALEQKGFKYWGHLDLDPGEYRVRVLVRNPDTGRSGVAAARIEVPSPGEREPLLLPPFFPEPFDRWVWGREEEAERRPGASHPFQYGDNPFFPAARPEVSAAGEFPVSLMAYRLGPGRLAVDCQVLDGAGQEVPGGGSLVLAGEARGAAGLTRLAATFRAGKLPTGDYLLRVRVKNLDTDEEQTSSIPIRVL